MRDVPPLSQTAYRALRIFFRQPPLVQLHLQQNQMVTLAGTAGSLLAGTSLRELRFRQRFNATVLAAKRTGATLRDRLGRLVLREGDLLLIQAPLDALRGLQQSIDLVVLGQLNADLPTTHSKYLAVAVMATVLLLSGLGVMLLVAAIHAWPAYAALVAVYTLTLGPRAAQQCRLRGPATADRRGVRRQPELPLHHWLPDQPDGLRSRPLSLLYALTVPALVLWLG